MRIGTLMLIVATCVVLGAGSAGTPNGLAHGDVAIANLEDALTFARLEADGRVLAVRSYSGGRVSGVDLSVVFERDIRDPIALLNREGWQRVQKVVEVASSTAVLDVGLDALGIPVDLAAAHIAAGTNFPEHAGETSVEEGPFLFPKLVEPTGPHADVPARMALLDYEVELAWVTAHAVAEGEPLTWLGLILCIDYTDREALLQRVDVADVASGKGFTTGKSFPGYLPVGNLFVVPRDVRSFVQGLELRLTVNGELRQQAPASAMIWDLDELLAETWKRRDVTWEHRGRRVRLLDAAGHIPERTLLLSGTPEGTIFRDLSLHQKLAGLAAWLFGGWERSIPAHAIDIYIEDARQAKIYLQPGDEVVAQADHLGTIASAVTP